MVRHGGGSFDATTKVDDALKLKIADGEVLISIRLPFELGALRRRRSCWWLLAEWLDWKKWVVAGRLADATLWYTWLEMFMVLKQ